MNIVRFQNLITKFGNVFMVLCLLALNSGSVQIVQAAAGNTMQVSVVSSGAQGGYDSTIQTQKLLYNYNRSPGAGFAGLGAATQMMVSNNSDFSGASWEPYQANKAWTLASGNGWREVYVKTRDKFNHNLTVSDTIYLYLLGRD